jgi:ABC-type multidrug transport system fused ATPase/permease subunit
MRAFVVMAVALTIGVLGGIAVSLLAAGLTADWSAAVRRELCRVALGQTLPTLDATPVGELLDRIDGDVYQVASELRNSGVRIAQSATVGALAAAIAVVVWWPAGLAMLAIAITLGVRLRRPAQEITPVRMAEEEAWSDLAAVMEESIHGQDDVRTSLARPYVLRLFAQRASVVLTRGRQVWTMSARVTSVASVVTRGGIAAIVVGGAWALFSGRVDGARLTAVWSGAAHSGDEADADTCFPCGRSPVETGDGHDCVEARLAGYPAPHIVRSEEP